MNKITAERFSGIADVVFFFKRRTDEKCVCVVVACWGHVILYQIFERNVTDV